MDEAVAGDIVLVTGIEDLSIGCTITDSEKPEALPMLKIDEPTLNMTFMVNNSPLAGSEGQASSPAGRSVKGCARNC
jgi:GTP-binding protein